MTWGNYFCLFLERLLNEHVPNNLVRVVDMFEINKELHKTIEKFIGSRV